MLRSHTLQSFHLLLVIALIQTVAGIGQSAEKNILLIVTDDQSPDLGCYGNRVIKTPHIDSLATEGVRLSHAFCTTASCSASRSVILTGLYNHANAHYGHAHSYHHFTLYAKTQTLPVRLAEAGYRTAQCGKVHVEPAELVKFHHAIKANARNTVEMAENCQAFLSEKSEQPFFLYFCPADPHRDGQIVEGDPHQANSFGNRPQGHAGVETISYDPAEVIVPPFLPDSPTSRAELAQYYQSISRVDQGVGRLISILKETGQYDQTLILFTSDHGMAFPGGKTTCYEGGLHVPFLVKFPASYDLRGKTSDALINFADITPTLLDFAGALPDSPVQSAEKEPSNQEPEKKEPTKKESIKREPAKKTNTPFHGRSFLAAIGQEHPADWDETYASHTFHEITMYYPMRVVRTRRFKLIWNIAHPLPYPFASDLWAAPTWQAAYKQGPETLYGQRTVAEYIHRPQFELFDLQADPKEGANLADRPQYAQVLEELKTKLKKFQKETKDPWVSKWDYE